MRRKQDDHAPRARSPSLFRAGRRRIRGVAPPSVALLAGLAGPQLLARGELLERKRVCAAAPAIAQLRFVALQRGYHSRVAVGCPPLRRGRLGRAGR